MSCFIYLCVHKYLNIIQDILAHLNVRVLCPLLWICFPLAVVLNSERQKILVLFTTSS